MSKIGYCSLLAIVLWGKAVSLFLLPLNLLSSSPQLFPPIVFAGVEEPPPANHHTEKKRKKKERESEERVRGLPKEIGSILPPPTRKTKRRRQWRREGKLGKVGKADGRFFCVPFLQVLQVSHCCFAQRTCVRVRW